MYSNKENVNILTSLLVDFGIKKAVVCPGSRNSPIVHNLCSCGRMKCYPVTDERSAGFFAIGLAEALNMPVAVCVTSGSALLNLAPAVAEAYYRNIQLIVVSADRPLQWISQSDGQTIRQQSALEPNIRKSVSLPEPTNAEERWFCNRLINEALNETRRHGGGPVHINVPISEPLFVYTTPFLPCERTIMIHDSTINRTALETILEKEILKADRPMLVLGQLPKYMLGNIETIEKVCLVLRERPANNSLQPQPIDQILSAGIDESMQPDVIIYIGGTIVSKELKRFLRNCSNVKSILIDDRAEIRDTFMNLSHVVEASPDEALDTIVSIAGKLKPGKFVKSWHDAIRKACQTIMQQPLDYSHEWAVRELFKQLPRNVETVCGNSTAIRLANKYSDRYIFVNRGVNGIEGSLSTAVGHSVAIKHTQVCCIIGDLSFFYDQNALWNQNLGNNLRIILLNNHGGGIFRQLPGLEQSPFRDKFIAAAHVTSAREVCCAHNLEYLEAHNKTEFNNALESFFNRKERSALLEVFIEIE